MFTKYKFLLLAVLSFSFVACEIDDFVDANLPPVAELPELNTNGLDFSNYVAVGASFTAGFTDNGLFIAAQENSFPNILAQQFGTSNFTQPLMNDNVGGLLLGGVQIQGPRLFFDGAGPAPVPGTPTTEVTNVLSGSFNNMGVPGAKSFHVVAPGYGNLAGVATGAANPYFARFASSGATTMLTDALAQNPSFFTLSELGGNDVLGYATSGGTGVDQTGNFDPTTYGGNDITDPNVFASTLSSIVDAMTANGARGAVTNVPYITDLPHFTTVPYNPIPLDAATAAAVNGAYAAYNGGLQLALANGLISADEAAARTIVFAESPSNAVVIEDEDLTNLGALGLPNYRQATPGDLFVLPSLSFIGTLADPGNPLSVNGVAIPLADNWVLIPSEQEAILNATNAYNATIGAIASANSNVALVDLNSVLTEAASTGIAFDDFTLTTDLVTGGLVSLDGIHLTGKGYALMANKFLEAIDAQFGTNFIASGTTAKAVNYPTNYSPTLQ